VGCVVADAMSHFAFLYRDQQARAIAMMTTVEHPSIGTYWRYAPVLTLSDTPSRAPAFCDLGEHTRALLAETGYDGDEIERLHDHGVVGWFAENAAVTQE
jgi:crotonobetainyl-CoA:carnitine CoA-transferase CaiB-like acyl-CoA transferase